LLASGSVYAEDRNGSNFPMFIEDRVHGDLKIPPGSLILEANWFTVEQLPPYACFY